MDQHRSIALSLATKAAVGVFLAALALAPQWSLADDVEQSGPAKSTELVVGENWEVKDHRLEIEFRDDMSLSLANPHGDVWVRGDDGHHVIIEASVQKHVLDPRSFRFDQRDEDKHEDEHEDEHAVVIVPAFADDQDLRVPDTVARFESLRRVDLGLRIPSTMRLSVTTVDGKIDIADMTGPVAVSSDSGPIRVHARGPIHAVNGSGQTIVSFVVLDGESSIRSKTGSMEVFLTRNASFALSGATRGPITSDFSMRVDRNWDTGLKNFSIMVGKPEVQIEIESQRGPVAIYQTGVLVPAARD